MGYSKIPAGLSLFPKLAEKEVLCRSDLRGFTQIPEGRDGKDIATEGTESTEKDEGEAAMKRKLETRNLKRLNTESSESKEKDMAGLEGRGSWIRCGQAAAFGRFGQFSEDQLTILWRLRAFFLWLFD